MATKITYTDKIKSVDLPNPAEEKFRADDANEIKTVVNSHADDIDQVNLDVAAVESDITTIQSDITNLDADITTIQSDITELDSRLDNAETDISTLETEINNKIEIGGDIGGTIINPIIDNEAITNAKLAHIPTNRIKGRANSGNGIVEDLTVPEIKDMLSIDQIDNTSDEDKPISTAQATEFDNKIDKNVGATYTTNVLTTVTQTEYNALTPDANTLYFIV